MFDISKYISDVTDAIISVIILIFVPLVSYPSNSEIEMYITKLGGDIEIKKSVYFEKKFGCVVGIYKISWEGNLERKVIDINKYGKKRSRNVVFGDDVSFESWIRSEYFYGYGEVREEIKNTVRSSERCADAKYIKIINDIMIEKGVFIFYDFGGNEVIFFSYDQMVAIYLSQGSW